MLKVTTTTKEDGSVEQTISVDRHSLLMLADCASCDEIHELATKADLVRMFHALSSKIDALRPPDRVPYDMLVTIGEPTDEE